MRYLIDYCQIKKQYKYIKILIFNQLKDYTQALHSEYVETPTDECYRADSLINLMILKLNIV